MFAFFVKICVSVYVVYVFYVFRCDFRGGTFGVVGAGADYNRFIYSSFMIGR